MGFYATAIRAPRRGKTAPSLAHARQTTPQPLEPHQENPPTPTATASGVRFYGYRLYNPELGRWINRDPIEEEGGLNLYGFVLNNPLQFIDILGALVLLYQDPLTVNVEIYYKALWALSEVEIAGSSARVRRSGRFVQENFLLRKFVDGSGFYSFYKYRQETDWQITTEYKCVCIVRNGKPEPALEAIRGSGSSEFRDIIVTVPIGVFSFRGSYIVDHTDMTLQYETAGSIVEEIETVARWHREVHGWVSYVGIIPRRIKISDIDLATSRTPKVIIECSLDGVRPVMKASGGGRRVYYQPKINPLRFHEPTNPYHPTRRTS